MAFEEVSERIEAIPVLNEGFMLVHWPEGGEETEATERAVSITVRGDDTLLTGLEKLGNEILVLWRREQLPLALYLIQFG